MRSSSSLSLLWFRLACWAWMMMVLGVFVPIVHPVTSLAVQSVASVVALKDIPFDLGFTVEYHRADFESTTLDGLAASLTFTDDESSIVARANYSIYDDKGRRRSEFSLDEVVVSRLGNQQMSVVISLFERNSTGPLERPESPRARSLFGLWIIPGGYTLVPLLVTMVVAIWTRNVLPALFCGVMTASFFIYQFDLPAAFARTLDSIIMTALTDSRNQFVILFAMVMGGFVNMVNESGGSTGLANALATFAKTGQSTQAVTLFFGLLIFFDDYASALILGATLRTVADRMSVSREKFTFLVDSGAAPIAALIPITSWTAFESALLQAEADKLVEEGIDLKALGYETSGFMGLLRMLKYAYYSIYLLFFQVFLIGSKREFGPMFVAERKALVYGVSDERYGFRRAEDTHGMADDDNFKPPPRCRNAGIPILFFVIYAITAMVVLGAAAVPSHEQVALHNIFANVDSIVVMYYGSALATFLAAFIYRIQSVPIPTTSSSSTATTATAADLHQSQPSTDGRVVVSSSPGVCARILCCRGSSSRRRRPLMTCSKSIDAFVQGFSHLTSTIMVLVLAWSIGAAVDFLGAGRFLATSLEGNVPPESLPVLIFLISCFVAFCTGSSWATMAVLYPICGPIAFQMSPTPEIYYCSMAAILEGSVFGDHCSFISDTTIMSAMACRCPLTSHVITQLPYAIFCALICLSCGYLPIGMQTLDVASTYFVGFAAIAVGIFVLGARPDGRRLDLLNWISTQVRTKILGTDPESIEILKLLRVPVGDGHHPEAAEPLQERGSASRRKGSVGDPNAASVTGGTTEVKPALMTLRRPSFETEKEDVSHRRQREHEEEQRRQRPTSSREANPFEVDFGLVDERETSFRREAQGDEAGGTRDAEMTRFEDNGEHMSNTGNHEQQRRGNKVEDSGMTIVYVRVEPVVVE